MRRKAVVIPWLLLAAAALFPVQLPPAIPVGADPSAEGGVAANGTDTWPADDPGASGAQQGLAGRSAGSGLPPGPSPDSLRVAPALVVQTLKPTRAYTGRGTFYLLVQELPTSTVLPYVGSREGWVLVQTPGGGFGWVVGTDLVVGNAKPMGLSYVVRPGQWEMRGPAGLPEVEVRREGAGMARLTLRTSPDTLLRVVEPDRGTVAILTEPGSAELLGAMEVGEGGIGALSLTERGLLVDLEAEPLVRVVAQTEGRVELEFRPGLSAIEKAGEGWRFRLRGDARPVLRQAADGLFLDIPGAGLAPGFTLHRGGAAVTEVGPETGSNPAPATSPTATVPTRMAAGGVRIRLPTGPVGEPPVLYRPEPGVVELRFLKPGLAGKVIYLDPGHGGEETGAQGPAGNNEKDINLAVALRVRTLLEAEGAHVLIARTADARALPLERQAFLQTYSERTRADLEHRIQTANQAGVDLYLSIHGNGGPAGDRGTETYWSVSNLNADQSRRLAGLLQNELLKALGLPDRGVKQRGFHVIRYADAPSALVETGFVTHPAEERLLVSATGQGAVAQALVHAVQRFFGSEN